MSVEWSLFVKVISLLSPWLWYSHILLIATQPAATVSVGAKKVSMIKQMCYKKSSGYQEIVWILIKKQFDWMDVINNVFFYLFLDFAPTLTLLYTLSTSVFRNTFVGQGERVWVGFLASRTGLVLPWAQPLTKIVPDTQHCHHFRSSCKCRCVVGVILACYDYYNL